MLCALCAVRMCFYEKWKPTEVWTNFAHPSAGSSNRPSICPVNQWPSAYAYQTIQLRASISITIYPYHIYTRGYLYNFCVYIMRVRSSMYCVSVWKDGAGAGGWNKKIKRKIILYTKYNSESPFHVEWMDWTFLTIDEGSPALYITTFHGTWMTERKSKAKT